MTLYRTALNWNTPAAKLPAEMMFIWTIGSFFYVLFSNEQNYKKSSGFQESQIQGFLRKGKALCYRFLDWIMSWQSKRLTGNPDMKSKFQIFSWKHKSTTSQTSRSKNDSMATTALIKFYVWYFSAIYTWSTEFITIFFILNIVKKCKEGWIGKFIKMTVTYFLIY